MICCSGSGHQAIIIEIQEPVKDNCQEIESKIWTEPNGRSCSCVNVIGIVTLDWKK